MDRPDWNQCSEEELWRYVAWHLEGAGIESVLVGGAVVAIYTEGLYRSGDLDLVVHSLDRGKVADALAKIGFETTRSRYYKHPKCDHMFLEFPPGPVELGNEHPIYPAVQEIEGRALKILSPTDCVKDRLAGFIHWNARDLLDQAALVCLRQTHRIEWKEIERWCEAEDGKDAFIELQKAVERGVD
jgi:hypothetical protein